ncbi:MAG: substrate-binding domain-containing protein [Proteobacteria bacterium]|uniref:substrate-binding domain-containing protein n=1 Tax=Aquabacterium sp. TaxID=1872578 RepID=UPI0035C774CD|nr:substrate-binding domain-containing protein [Pseudomonadota bacterium]
MPRNDSDKRRVQMMDIARLAGVSASTVSRALNGSTLINPETRQRIVDLARSMNYSINASAKSLRLGYNPTIAVVIPFDHNTRQRISDPFFLSMLGSLADALTERGHDLLLSRVDADKLLDLAAIHDTGRAGAVAVIGQWGQHAQLNELADRGVPFVVWGAQLPDQRYCTIGTDNILGGRLATEHLLSLGRRRIVFMGDTTMPEAAQPAIRRLLDQGVPFDAIFAASDLIAMNTMGVLLSRGLRVPQDISIVGYDDIDAAARWHPPLTTIRQPVDQAGVAMVERLLQIAKGQRPESQLLQASLVVRESTAARTAA